MGTDTGYDTDNSPHISLQKEAICRVYQEKFGHIMLGIFKDFEVSSSDETHYCSVHGVQHMFLFCFCFVFLFFLVGVWGGCFARKLLL